MAVTIDAKSGVCAAGGQSTTSVSHTCTGSNLILVLGCSDSNGPGTPTSITYNGVAMTQLKHVIHSAGNFNGYLYYMLNPPTGANTIQVVWSAAEGQEFGAISFAGVDQNPPTTISTAENYGGSMSFSLTDATDDLVFGYAQGNLGSGTISSLTSQAGTDWTSSCGGAFSFSTRGKQNVITVPGVGSPGASLSITTTDKSIMMAVRLLALAVGGISLGGAAGTFGQTSGTPDFGIQL